MIIIPESIIGKKYTPSDNSFCLCLSVDIYSQLKFDRRLAGTQVGESPKETVIISEPYEQLITEGSNDTYNRKLWFVNVRYEDREYRVLYNERGVQWNHKPVEKVYVGVQIVKAIPITNYQFLIKYPGLSVKNTTVESQDGYQVEYEDGYIEWLSKEIFERAYREVTEKEKNLINK